MVSVYRKRRSGVPGFVFRTCGFLGLVAGFLVGVSRMISKGMDCAYGGVCPGGSPDPNIANFLVPIGIGLVGGLLLGWLLMSLLRRV